MKAKILLVWMFAYLAGCFWGSSAPAFGNRYVIFASLSLVLSFLFLRKVWLFATIFAIGIFALSLYRFEIKSEGLRYRNNLASGSELQLRVMVDDLSQKALHGDKVRLRVVSGRRELLNSQFFGYVKSAQGLDYGEIIELTVKIKPYQDKNKWRLMNAGVIGESNIGEYVSSGRENSIIVFLKGRLLSVRKSLNDALSKTLPEREAGLASGIIMGEKALISPEMQNALKASGTTHIIALSGYNITIILGVILLLRKKMSRITGLVLPVILIGIFTVMTGGAPSLVRAAIMGSMPLMAAFLYRENNSFIAIIFSATVMAGFNPFLPLYDIGFQLSFVAIAGIIYLSPIVANLMRNVGANVSPVLSETIAAQLATLPLISFYFGTISLISPVTNFVVLGILPVCMLLSFITGLFALALPQIGNIVSLPTYVLLNFVNNVIEWSGSVSWASASIKIENPWWIFILYLLIFDIWLYFRKVGHTVPTE